MKTFKRFMAVVLVVLLVVPFSVFSVFAGGGIGYEDNWNYVATDGTIAVVDGAIVVKADGTAQIVSKNVSDFDGASVTFNTTADNVSFALSNYPAPYAEPTIGGAASYYGVLTSVQYPGEYTMNVTLSDGVDLGYTVLGVAGDNIYDVGTFTVISNGNFWGNKSNTTFNAVKGEYNTITFHNFYNQDDGGWELSYDVNNVYHYASDFTGAFDEADNYLDYTLIVGGDGPVTVYGFNATKHTCEALTTIQVGELVTKCTVCEKTLENPEIADWDLVGTDGTIVTVDENGAITLDGDVVKFVSKQAYDFNGTSVDFSSTAANVSFLLTNTPAPSATAVIGTAAPYLGHLTTTQYAGEFSYNVTLSDGLDLGWSVLGVAGDNIYDVGTFAVISNGNFWGNKSNTTFNAVKGEYNTITFHNFYNQDDGGWELSYDVNNVYHYASDFTGAFDEADNYLDYTLIVGGDGPVTVYGFNATKHTCEGKWTIDGIAFNNEFVCAKCGKLLDTANVTSVDGRTFTVANVTDGSKDIFVISGSDYTTYAEVKAAKDAAAYYERQTNLKLTADGNYVFDELLPGNYVVLLRFADGTEIAKNFTIEGYNPTMTEDGRYITVTSEADYGYVFVIKGHYDSYAAIKADRDTAEYYFGYNGSKIVNNTVKAFVPTYGEEYTICSKTLDGTTTFKYVTVEEPTFVTVNATATGLTGLDNIAKVRYAAGEYTTDRDVKNADGAKVVVARDLDGATTYDFAEALVGTYTFSVTYTSGIVNVFTLTF